jgi:murein DD-endopeptidase MepM/ murein hydrolase activator NlpD
MGNVARSFLVLFCLSLQLIWGLLFFPTPIQAADQPSLPDLQQKQQQIEQYRSSVMQAKERIEQQEQRTRDRLSGLEEKIEATASQVETHEDKLKTATEKLKQIEQALAIAQAKYGKQQTSATSRLRYLQRQGEVPGWTALMQSRSLEDLVNRQYRLKQVYGADNQVLVSLKKEKDAIETKKLEAETQRNQIALINQQLLTQKASLEDQAQSEKILVNRLTSDRQALLAAEQQLAQESAAISQNIQQRLAARIAFPGAIFLPGSGKMLVPADGPLTSVYGWRVHPIFGNSRFHNGIDFGAEYGSPIRAADNGVVIAADWQGGYGNTVMIDHGNGLVTLYAHASELLVTVGQPVQKGQVIAKIGSTGFSTGPHLHFEVRQAGEPVDPVPFLT